MGKIGKWHSIIINTSKTGPFPSYFAFPERKGGGYRREGPSPAVLQRRTFSEPLKLYPW